MQGTIDPSPDSPLIGLARGLAWFLLVPLFALLVLSLLVYGTVNRYQESHVEQIFTGVQVGGVDVGGLSRAEAVARLQGALSAPQQTLTLRGAEGGVWVWSFNELGVQYALDDSADLAWEVGRRGDENDRLNEQAQAWYAGRNVPPVTILDEKKVDEVILRLAGEIEQLAQSAEIRVEGGEIGYTEGQNGSIIDKSALRQMVIVALIAGESAELTIPMISIEPRIATVAGSAEQLQTAVSAPLQLYVAQPLEGMDLQNWEIAPQQLVTWLEIDHIESAEGVFQPQLRLDEEKVTAWLKEQEPKLYREPVRARFYFDDYTKELVLVEPHQNGRVLDIPATIQAISTAITGTQRTIPLAIQEIVPTANANATGPDLGITELITTAVTYFGGSPPQRMANIARSAANFYGIIIAPGEQFSFNHYLGEISEEQGYERGLIIVGGRTIEGVGGGVCQVSTTIFQAAFLGGYQIDERWQHGYRVWYYESGLGAGFDATVFSPEIDFRFTNDTPYHLLIENYYNEETQSLTFKFYSTSMGRRVTWTTELWGETEPKPDLYEYNPEVEGNELKQVDWAVGGAKVLVKRTIYNKWDEIKMLEEPFYSDYIPWANIYQYGDEYVFPPPRPTAAPQPAPSEPTATP